MRRALVLLSLVLGACAVRPAFIPPPQRVFAHFEALDRPMRDLAVGALWIEGHGAYGPGATPDNLETLPGISGVTIDSELAASLTLGFLQYLDLDPSLQRKVSVRLNDVSLVQVKDLAALAGPDSQPRIYEALRAGSATITASRDAGLAIEARASEQGLPVFERGNTGQRSTFSIEARDVYLAVHVATFRTAESDPVEIDLASGRRTGRIALLDVQAAADKGCTSATLKATKGAGPVVDVAAFDPHAPKEFKLGAPVADMAVLFDRISVTPITPGSGRCAIMVTMKGSEIVSQD